MDALLAVPSMARGGLDAPVSAHFGRCKAFTLVALRNGRIERTTVVEAPDHGTDGCMTPVNLLAAHGVTAIAAGGMGRRPLLGLLEVGIQPYFAGQLATVKNVVSAFVGGGLKPFGHSSCCGGDGHGDGPGDGPHAGSCRES